MNQLKMMFQCLIGWKNKNWVCHNKNYVKFKKLKAKQFYLEDERNAYIVFMFLPV